MHRTVLITGATGGIGGAAAKAIARDGATTILLVRDARRGEEVRRAVAGTAGHDRVELLVGDLSRPDSTRRAADELRQRHPALHAIVHCAAVFTGSRQTTPEGFERMFATNYLGRFVLTESLLDLLRRSAPSRIVAVSAPSGSTLDYDDLQHARDFSPLRAFGRSVAANLMLAFDLARRLEGTGVTSNALHPGLVRSDLMREAPPLLRGFLTTISARPAKAGDAVAWMALAPELDGVTGTFFRRSRRPLPAPPTTLDPDTQRRLRDATERLLGATPA